MKPNRERLETDNPEVAKYVFANRNPEYDNWVQRYVELFTKAQGADALKATMTPAEKRAFRGILSDEERSEMRGLSQKIKGYKSDQSRDLQSVVANSSSTEVFDSGKDNTVYLDDLGRYVQKYSSNEYEAKPETIEYLKKKYQILKKYLGDLIPDSYFVFGERHIELKKKINETIMNNSDNRKVAITLQRRVKGKNFKEMSDEEKNNPEIIEALRKAFSEYCELKTILAEATSQLGLPDDTLDVKLDLGELSKKSKKTEFDPTTISNFKSPNIMWDSEKRKIRFIDFDMNDWNPDKQKVYEALMAA